MRTNIQTNVINLVKTLEKEIDRTQQEATNILRIHRGKYISHMNVGTMESEDYLKSEEEWNTIDEKLKTLKQVKLTIESYRNKTGEIEDVETLDKELLNYINIVTEKELHNIVDIFKYSRKQLGFEHSKIEELIKLKIKEGTNSHYIKETFLKACQNLDASIFEPLIGEDQYFEDLDKYRFLHSMKEQFDYLKGLGLKKVQLVMGTCKMCFTGERVYEFYKVPKKGRPAFAYNIQEEDGNIKDIFKCNYSDGYERDTKRNMDSSITFIND